MRDSIEGENHYSKGDDLPRYNELKRAAAGGEE